MKRVICILLLICCFSCKKLDEVENKQEKYVSFPPVVFGFDMINLTSKKVIRILREKSIPFRSFNPYREIKIDDPINSPICIETNYFIGSGIDRSKISRLIYHFEPFHGSVEIEIEMKNDYYEKLQSIFKKKYGQGFKKYYEEDNNKYAIIWEANPRNKSSIELISINKFGSLLFYNGFGLKKRDDCFYLLIRSRPKELEHGQFHPYKR